MFALRNFRLAAVFVSLFAVLTLASVSVAEARGGGSFGSRGMRTHQTVPPTQTLPRNTGPVTYSTTPRTSTQPGVGAQAQRNNWFGGGLGGWIVGGLVFSGLFGLMFGTGFGGFGGFLALLIQVVVLVFVLRWLFRRFGPQPQTANGMRYDYAPPQRDRQTAGGARPAASATRSRASQRAGRRDEIGVTDSDLQVFEQRLTQVQDAYSREDLNALRRIATPEVFEYLVRELEESRAKGQRNEVFDVRLLEGDVAEAWREGETDYATATLRYESRDVMRDRSTGAIVSGEDRPAERTEVWTFVRRRGSDWLLSAIQE
jgi:predicted lipid-binding transport protein (Tim44 family)